MIHFLAILMLLSGPAPLENIPTTLPNPVAQRAQESQQKLMTFDCPLLIQLYHPLNLNVNSLGLCFYNLTLEQGIFAVTTCVGVLIEPDTGTRNPFYGKNGHWGVEGKCEGDRLKKKFDEPLTEKTVNPLTAVRLKRQEGLKLLLLKDDFKLWNYFDAKTKPKK